jgi:hypothetical protein
VATYSRAQGRCAKLAGTVRQLGRNYLIACVVVAITVRNEI